MKLIIFIIIFLFFCIKYSNKNNINNFSNNINLYNSNYLNNFNDLDYKLRKCKKEKCLNEYNNFILYFSEKEQIKVNNIKYKINSVINNLFYKNIFNFDFIKVKNSMENSLPHTRKSYIVLSQKWFERIFSYKNIMNEPNYFKLFFHELFHIFQRNNPKLINILYKDYWNLIKFDKKIPKNIKNIIRTNPDALPNNNWLFKLNNKYILPLCVYLKNSKNITDAKNIYYELDNNFNFINVNKNYDLMNLKEYSNYFGINNSNNYHPNELSSSIFENLIYNLHNNIETNGTTGYKKLKMFLITNCYLKNL